MKERLDGTTPPDNNRLRLTHVKKTAAGIPAAVSSMNHGIRKMGLTKTVRTLLMVNQKDVGVPSLRETGHESNIWATFFITG